MNYENGEFTEWTDTGDIFVRSYVKSKEGCRVKIPDSCATCGEPLKPNIWYIQINDEYFDSEECALEKYPHLLGPFHKREEMKIPDEETIRKLKKGELFCDKCGSKIEQGTWIPQTIFNGNRFTFCSKKCHEEWLKEIEHSE